MSGEALTKKKPPIQRALQVLGGDRAFERPVQSRLEVHDMIEQGFQAKVLDHLVKLIGIVGKNNLEKTVGISVRTYQRHKEAPAKRLNPVQSGRVWKFAEILSRATDVLGSQEDAEEWLARPAVALEQRRPIDLLSTPAGVESLEEHLTRLEYGVYT
jgi:putative toxin-antitoxin system antitoxin component (TIGR02293 family)